MRIHEPGKDDIAVNITQALEKDIDGRHITIILDIDAFKVKEFAADGKAIWPTFEKLHQLKNDVFFQSVTEKTVSMFE